MHKEKNPLLQIVKSGLQKGAERISSERLGKFEQIVDRINNLENEYTDYSDSALHGQTEVFRQKLKSQEVTVDELLPEAFAAVREASKRKLGLRHHDVQLMAGIAMHMGEPISLGAARKEDQGGIAELRTGEGKTLAAILTLYLNALKGENVHLVTANDYLARRDARWMAPVFEALGMTVGVLQGGEAGGQGKIGYLVDSSVYKNEEQFNHLKKVARRESYRADITYGTNAEFGFDYLRDNLSLRKEDRVQNGHSFALIDEVDNILIDEARTPLIITGPRPGDLYEYQRMNDAVRMLDQEDLEISEKDRTISLTESGYTKIREKLGKLIMDPGKPEEITPEQALAAGKFEQALRARFLFKRNKDYLVKAGKIIIVDEFTGRQMPGRSWSDGLHQAVQAKEGVTIEPETEENASVTLQSYFGMYSKLAGMTGTGLTSSEEFMEVYKLPVIPIPSNLEYLSRGQDSPLVKIETRDAAGNPLIQYARWSEPDTPLFFDRQDFEDRIYRTGEAKIRSITLETITRHVKGQPLLLGTGSVEASDTLASRLDGDTIRSLLRLQLYRAAWLQEHKITDPATAVEELQDLNLALPSAYASMRVIDSELAGRVNDLLEPGNFQAALNLLGLKEEDAGRLRQVLNNGIPRQVLNARNHASESQIIAGAGAYGAVTIATNMAGRGVDIKLGGEIAEEVLTAVKRFLADSSHPEAYDLSPDEIYQLLQRFDSAQLLSRYHSEIMLFQSFMEDRERVKKLGGLHIIGSERHESRRIDNQLRGRAARQGDPGSSQFILSLEDDIVIRSGLARTLERSYQKIKTDDSVSLSDSSLTRVIDRAQVYIEGSNSDVRKHLREYDEVVFAQWENVSSIKDFYFESIDVATHLNRMLEPVIREEFSAAQVARDLPSFFDLIDHINRTDFDPVTAELHPTFIDNLLLEKIRRAPDAVTGIRVLVSDSLNAEHIFLKGKLKTLFKEKQESAGKQRGKESKKLEGFLHENKNEEDLAGLYQRARTALNIPFQLVEPDSPEFPTTLTGLGQILRHELEVKEARDCAAACLHDIGARMPGLEKINYSGIDTMADSEKAVSGALEGYINLQNSRLFSEDSKLEKTLASLDVSSLTDHQILKILHDSQLSLPPFSYLIADLLKTANPSDIFHDITESLHAAQQFRAGLLGYQAQLNLPARDGTLLKELDPFIVDLIGAEKADLPLAELGEKEKRLVRYYLGKKSLDDLYRTLIAGFVTSAWKENLARLNALRISVGLEAYAQRDPLAAYKIHAGIPLEIMMEEIKYGLLTRAYFGLAS